MPTKPKTSGYVCIGGTCGRSDLGADEIVQCVDCRDLVCINCAIKSDKTYKGNALWHYCRPCADNFYSYLNPKP